MNRTIGLLNLIKLVNRVGNAENVSNTEVREASIWLARELRSLDLPLEEWDELVGKHLSSAMAGELLSLILGEEE